MKKKIIIIFVLFSLLLLGLYLYFSPPQSSTNPPLEGNMENYSFSDNVINSINKANLSDSYNMSYTVTYTEDGDSYSSYITKSGQKMLHVKGDYKKFSTGEYYYVDSPASEGREKFSGQTIIDKSLLRGEISDIDLFYMDVNDMSYEGESSSGGYVYSGETNNGGSIEVTLNDEGNIQSMTMKNITVQQKYMEDRKANVKLEINTSDDVTVEKPSWTNEVPQDGIESVG